MIFGFHVRNWVRVISPGMLLARVSLEYCQKSRISYCRCFNAYHVAPSGTCTNLHGAGKQRALVKVQSVVPEIPWRAPVVNPYLFESTSHFDASSALLRICALLFLELLIICPPHPVKVGAAEVLVVVKAIEVIGGAAGYVCGARTVISGIDV